MQSIPEIVAFLKKVFTDQGKQRGVIAVSGGIDSALSVTLLCQAIGPEHVYPLLLPYGEQSTADSRTICAWNKIPEGNWNTVDIKPIVDQMSTMLNIGSWKLDISRQRRGNIMARTRMIIVFDTAKALNALVCGTENKSEHHLGYFTRFGDAASDIEPICGLYKTEVRSAVKELGLPEVFLTKAPSAGLWDGQTDEAEMGFSYADADRALKVLLGESDESVDPALLAKVKKAMETQAFKLQVPYVLTM